MLSFPSFPLAVLSARTPARRSSGDDGREHIRHAGWVPDALLVHPGIGPLQLCSAFISPEDLAQAAA